MPSHVLTTTGQLTQTLSLLTKGHGRTLPPSKGNLLENATGWVHLAAGQEMLTLHSRYLPILHIFCRQYMHWSVPMAAGKMSQDRSDLALPHTHIYLWNGKSGSCVRRLSLGLPWLNAWPRLSATHYWLLLCNLLQCTCMFLLHNLTLNLSKGDVLSYFHHYLSITCDNTSNAAMATRVVVIHLLPPTMTGTLLHSTYPPCTMDL